jgi:hypothetical protein
MKEYLKFKPDGTLVKEPALDLAKRMGLLIRKYEGKTYVKEIN